MIELYVFATFSLCFLYALISDVGIIATVHLKQYIAAQAKGGSNKNKHLPPQVQKFSLFFQALSFLTSNCEGGLRQPICDENIPETCV